LYSYPLTHVNILGSQKCALQPNVPKLIWFKIDLMMTTCVETCRYTCNLTIN